MYGKYPFRFFSRDFICESSNIYIYIYIIMHIITLTCRQKLSCQLLVKLRPGYTSLKKILISLILIMFKTSKLLRVLATSHSNATREQWHQNTIMINAYIYIYIYIMHIYISIYIYIYIYIYAIPIWVLDIGQTSSSGYIQQNKMHTSQHLSCIT